MDICTGRRMVQPKADRRPLYLWQCRLDVRSGNDSTLTPQAVTVIELVPTDVCVDCGEPLLEALEVKDRA